MPNAFDQFLTQLQEQVDNVKAATDNAEIGNALAEIQRMMTPWLRAFKPLEPPPD